VFAKLYVNKKIVTLKNMATIAHAQTPKIFRKPVSTGPVTGLVPTHTAPRPMATIPPTPIRHAPTIMKPPTQAVPTGMDMVSSFQTEPAKVIPVTQAIPKPVAPMPLSQETSIHQSLPVVSQILSDHFRLQFKNLEEKIIATIKTCVKHEVGEGLRESKMQYEATQIEGETLHANTPLLGRPDPSAKVEHTFENKGTRLKLFHPIISNVHGHWMMSQVVTSNASVIKGYVPIFCNRIASVQYTLDEAELNQRASQWEAYRLPSEKGFIPHVGRFV
jgi:hypothetical protein